MVPLVCWCQKGWKVRVENKKLVGHVMNRMNEHFPKFSLDLQVTRMAWNIYLTSMWRGYGRAPMGARARMVPPSLPFQPQPPEPITRHAEARSTSRGAELRHATRITSITPGTLRSSIHSYEYQVIIVNKPASQSATVNAPSLPEVKITMDAM